MVIRKEPTAGAVPRAGPKGMNRRQADHDCALRATVRLRGTEGVFLQGLPPQTAAQTRLSLGLFMVQPLEAGRRTDGGKAVEHSFRAGARGTHPYHPP